MNRFDLIIRNYLKGGEHMKNGYAGKIKNTGSQKVEAPFASKTKAKGTVKKGTDLRTGK